MIIMSVCDSYDTNKILNNTVVFSEKISIHKI